ncbi:SDR family oxidoreductase [Gemmatimonadota bacterium]
MTRDYDDKAVLVTGSTKGIGLATGLAFGREGAHVYLTHRWSSADEDEVRARFTRAGAREPVIVEADASLDEDTVTLMELIHQEHDSLEVLVSNVCVVPVGEGLESWSKRALFKSLEYSSWPLVAYLQQAKETFQRYPRYVIGTSSDGPDVFYKGYEYVALSKAVLETFCRGFAERLQGEDVRINVVRTRNVITESALALHGRDYPDFVRRYAGESHFIMPEEVGDTILALCSGLLDALAGKVINVDRGGSFSDNLMRLYGKREEFGL